MSRALGPPRRPVAAGAGAFAAYDAVERVVAHGDEGALAERFGERAEGRDFAHAVHHVAVVFVDAARAHEAHALDVAVTRDRELEDDVAALAGFDRPIGEGAFELVVDALLEAGDVALDARVVERIRSG